MGSRHRPLFPLILLLLLSCGGDSTDPSQCAFLLHLKQSFNSTSSRLAAWQPGTDCCGGWDGVHCDGRSGLVTALDLSNSSFAGKISRSLFNLTSLRQLNLAYNKFDQVPIPDEIRRLANLTSLNLSNAGFVGQIPIGIAKLTNLVSLDLSTLSFDELPQSFLQLRNPNFETLISNLSNLRELYLDGINISAGGSQWAAAVSKSTPKLTALSLTSCSIGGPIDPLLLKLRDLSVIRLDQNELNCSVPTFLGNFSSLSEIRLSFCGLNGSFPRDVFLLKNLTVVDLSSNPMLSGSLPEFSDKSKLQKLVLSKTGFSSNLPNSIGKAKSLIKVDLSGCQFSGAIPSSIGNLTELVHLDLSLNNFTGSIPSTLPVRISELILSHNALSGSIPPSVGALEHLMKLDLSDNSLSGQIPASLFVLPSLHELRLNFNKLYGHLEEFSKGSSWLSIVDLSNNDLQGEIPRSVFQLSELKILTLASNNFTGTLELEQLTALRNLSNLDLSYNSISILENDSIVPVFLPKLSTLMLASCNLTRVPSFLRYQTQMINLDLSNNRLHGTIPSWIWTIGDNNLNYLNLSCNSFTSVDSPIPNLDTAIPIILDLHSNLLRGPIPFPYTSAVILDYSNNVLTSSIPSNISLYLNITVFFSVANNSLTGEIPWSICEAINLQVLDFSNNNFSGQIPQCLFQGGSNLGVLNFRRNGLEGTIPTDISEGCGLRTVNLNGNHLGGQIPRSLSNCSQLEVLDLGNNHISGPFPFWLGDITSLCVLVLRSNEFYGPVGHPSGTQIPKDAFSALRIFDISSNNFNGPLPVDCLRYLNAMMNSALNLSSVQFEYMQLEPSYYENTVTVTSKGMVMTLVRILTIFTSLDFSNNHFEGSIPEVVGDLQSLNVLNFSHNALTGSIPLCIGKLKQLESLDFSNNQISGTIPPELSALTFLSYLNLSCNNLVGRIPQANQFLTFSGASFEGNEGLCGLPLIQQCDNSSEFSLPVFNSTTEVNWQCVFVGIGFGGGLAMVLGTLMSWESGRSWYLKKVDSMLEAMIPSAFSRLCDYCVNRKVGAEDAMDCDSKEMDGCHGKKFCVFCTKLEFSQGKVRIHHVECDCPLEGE